MLGLSWFGIAAAASVQANEYAIGPPPPWVLPIEPGVVDNALLGQIRDGTYHLLSDSQTHISAEGRIIYRHFSTKAINAKGLESIANVQIFFDPSYQSLTLHSIDIIRDGRTIHKISGAQINILQRETELESRIYDGSKTANVFLDDVRVGDTVDYAYSVSGRNPVFKGVTFGTAFLQYNVPVGRIHVRLLLPTAERVSISARNTDLQATVEERNGYRDHVWDVRNVSSLAVETDAPGWYDPYASVQWSGYPDWNAVVRWAMPLYQVPDKLSPELQKEVDRIAQAEKSPAGRLIAALRFVQTEIRYLGVEIGPGSHAPNPPSLVFSRRFGDCKDKTLLLMSLLDRLGIESHAALVNTQKQRGVADTLPNPTVFDHVLVLAKIEGRPYWVDPTRTSQRGDLAHLYQPDYDYALVVDSNTRTLTPMKAVAPIVSKRSLHAVFDAREGFDKPVHFKLVSTLEGEAAELMRGTLASSNSSDLEKQYLNYYARYYPGIKSTEPLAFADDAANNSIVATESYDIGDFASWSAQEKRHSAEIDMPDIDGLLHGPTSSIRTAPLGLVHPREVTQITEVLLPDEWKIKPSTDKIEDPAFIFERKIAYEKQRIVFTDRYRSLVDEIPAQDVARYAGNLARAREVTGYQLTWTDPNGRSETGGFERFNWLIAVLGAFALVIWTGLAVIAYRYNPPAQKIAVKASLQGISGWLLLPALHTVIRPFLTATTLVHGADAWAMDRWAALTTLGSPQYHALWAPCLLFELIANLGLLVFSILLAVLFFLRRRSTPSFYIVFSIAVVAVQIIDHVMTSWLPIDAASNDTKAMAEIIRNVFGATIWCAYFLISERVKSTFVVDRVKRTSEAAIAT